MALVRGGGRYRHNRYAVSRAIINLSEEYPILAASLIYALNKSRSGLQELDTVVNRLIRTAIQTGNFRVRVLTRRRTESSLGLFSGIFAILTLVFYLARQDTELWAFFGLPISRLYTNVRFAL